MKFNRKQEKPRFGIGKTRFATVIVACFLCVTICLDWVWCAIDENHALTNWGYLSQTQAYFFQASRGRIDLEYYSLLEPGQSIDRTLTRLYSSLDFGGLVPAFPPTLTLQFAPAKLSLGHNQNLGGVTDANVYRFTSYSTGFMLTWLGFRFDVHQLTSPDGLSNPLERLWAFQIPHWFAIFFSGLVALIAARPSIALFLQHLRERRAPGAQPCPKCSYDLRAHAPGSACPECGTPVPASFKPPAPAAAPTAAPPPST